MAFFIPNTTLTFQTNSATPIGFDSVTDRPIFAPNLTTISASLEESETVGVSETIPGVDESSIYLSGHTVLPQRLPNEMIPNSFYDIEFNSGQQVLKGKFYMLPVVASRLGLETAFGDPIRGWLVFG